MRCFHGVDSDSNSLGGTIYKKDHLDGSFFVVLYIDNVNVL